MRHKPRSMYLTPRIHMRMRNVVLFLACFLILSLMLVLVLLLPTTALAQTFQCGEPKGIGMWSTENHKRTPAGFRGVEPIVIVQEQEMTVSRGDTKLNPTARSGVWRAATYHRSAQPVS